MLRALLAVFSVVAAKGIQLSDGPGSEDIDGAGVAGTLDPELTNIKGEKFHVTNEGEYLMVGMPSEVDMAKPEDADLLIEANFTQVGRHCDDLLIRKITLEGKALGSSISKLEFFVARDTFNDTASLGLTVTDDRGVPQTSEVEEFLKAVPECRILRPRGYIHLPTKKSWRRRTTTYHAVLNLQHGETTHEVNIFWATVWRGVSEVDGRTVYRNDLSFTVSGIGDAPAGLLGTDDHTDAIRMVAGCDKPQPVGGPYQQKKKGFFNNIFH
jgi:hypothetical protein